MWVKSGPRKRVHLAGPQGQQGLSMIALVVAMILPFTPIGGWFDT
jgi:hypothetical protein